MKQNFEKLLNLMDLLNQTKNYRDYFRLLRIRHYADSTFLDKFCLT
jgi:hypothetical protein